MSAELGYLGPQGTFSEEAAIMYHRRGGAGVLREYGSIEEVCAAVASGSIREGIVPLENILEGGVGDTLDALVVHDGIMIKAELICPIRHCLLAEEGLSPGQIHTVYSHPQALAQCRSFLEHNLTHALRVPVESTAAAANRACGEKRAAALAPVRAAAMYGLVVLAQDIQDCAANVTRFVVLAAEDCLPTGCDKTSLVLDASDGPGSLHRILGYFARREVNLTRIESRPARHGLGKYLFFIDCHGHRSEKKLENLFRALQKEVGFLKILGSYPREDWPPVRHYAGE